MDQYWRGRSTGALLVFMLLALGYTGLLYAYSPLTGEIRVDGAIGVVLGLYVCSHPASNVLDVLFLDGGAGRRGPAEERGIAWYTLNLLVLLAGWLVVLTGLACFTMEGGLPSPPALDVDGYRAPAAPLAADLSAFSAPAGSFGAGVQPAEVEIGGPSWSRTTQINETWALLCLAPELPPGSVDPPEPPLPALLAPLDPPPLGPAPLAPPPEPVRPAPFLLDAAPLLDVALEERPWPPAALPLAELLPAPVRAEPPLSRAGDGPAASPAPPARAAEPDGPDAVRPPTWTAAAPALPADGPAPVRAPAPLLPWPAVVGSTALALPGSGFAARGPAPGAPVLAPDCALLTPLPVLGGPLPAALLLGPTWRAPAAGPLAPAPPAALAALPVRPPLGLFARVEPGPFALDAPGPLA